MVWIVGQYTKDSLTAKIFVNYMTNDFQLLNSFVENCSIIYEYLCGLTNLILHIFQQLHCSATVHDPKNLLHLP